MRTLLTCSLALCLFTGLAAFAPPVAQADVLPPSDAGKTDAGSDCAAGQETGICAGKKAGDACTFANGTAGNCAALRCTNSDGTTMLACVATGAQPASSSGGSSDGTSTCAMGPSRKSANGSAVLVGLGLAVAALARKRRD